MEVAKIFMNGGSQAVRLPKSYRFNDDEVLINRIGEVVMLLPKTESWQSLLASLSMFTDDYLIERVESLPAEEREVLL